jgi:hypothetical protein
MRRDERQLEVVSRRIDHALEFGFYRCCTAGAPSGPFSWTPLTSRGWRLNLREISQGFWPRAFPKAARCGG